jgi:hypothetical protein
MSLIPTNPPVQIGPNTWRFTWSASAPHYVYHRGVLIAITNAATIDVVQGDGTVPVVEVATDPADVPEQVKHPGRLLLTWRTPTLPALVKIALYRVDRWDGSGWEHVAGVTPNASTYHRYQTAHQADDATARFRVVPVDFTGFEFPAVEFESLVVRLPDVPRVVYTYNPTTGVVTASAA